MQTDYKIDDYQDVYFVIDSFEQLFEATQQDFAPLYEKLSKTTDGYTPQTLLESDSILQKGTLEYSQSKLPSDK